MKGRQPDVAGLKVLVDVIRLGRMKHGKRLEAGAPAADRHKADADIARLVSADLRIRCG